MRKVLLVLMGVAPLLVLGLSGCSSDGDSANDVGVTLRDFKIELGEDAAKAGSVTFKVHNDGPSEHEFVVFKTELAADALPTDDNGDVAESDSFAPVDEIEGIKSGKSPTLTVDLEAGDYVLICNLPGHYRQGMHASFRVT